MSQPPQVSVCIITCNQQGYIRQCVESALAQASDVSLEILVGDDCSDDNTSNIVAEIAASNPDVVKHFRHEPRLGAGENAKVILSKACGEFIAHIDGDDYWLPGKLKLQLAYLRANPGCAAVYTNALVVSENGSPIGCLTMQEKDVSISVRCCAEAIF
jgi:glycosyltransferase involved in cell wall biosynthesis